ncbi:SDR family NAD(P)-dependent oxidoreductase [Paraburkholderia xenovorans]|uniref:SDR family NAD(P)-dependent oxidoreductase n=1 Tax=Paraburkholderia xenovorans TaxID=36873 RepID=UPI00155994C7|nr:SDR family oxidoreductase [Paraburkholderia xenovorans]NPT39200.1 SDR family oxidoreductase [Paraburkholderia xenovorans]
MNQVSRSYIVTGGGGGIGGATVLRLLRTGANVLAIDISSRRLNAVKEEAAGLPGRMEVLKADITAEQPVEHAVQLALELFGDLHGVANVAGGMPDYTGTDMDRPLESISLDYFHRMFALNVDSAFLMSKAATPHFRKKQYGKIVNVASLAAFANRPELGNAAYNPAKKAVIGLAETLSLLLGPDGIRVNTIAPGLVMSDKAKGALGDEYTQRHLKQVPLGRLATTSDLAEGIAFFLEPASDGITGETLRVAAGVR